MNVAVHGVIQHGNHIEVNCDSVSWKEEAVLLPSNVLAIPSYRASVGGRKEEKECLQSIGRNHIRIA